MMAIDSREKALDLMRGIAAVRQIQLLIEAANDPAFDDIFWDEDFSEHAWFVELVLLDLLEQLARVDKSRWRRTVMISDTETLTARIKAVGDPAIMQKFPHVFSEIVALNQKIAAID